MRISEQSETQLQCVGTSQCEKVVDFYLLPNNLMNVMNVFLKNIHHDPYGICAEGAFYQITDRRLRP